MGGSCEEPFPPLRIVLGAFSDRVAENGGSTPATPASSKDAPPPSSPATYILGTSYFATPRVGASSGVSRLPLNKDGRVPMEDRKGPLDHFKLRSLLLSTVRVTAINVSTTMSTFFSDQLNSEQEMEKRVDSGEITSREADKLNEEWEEREWKVRTDALPMKIGWGILRFHACTAVMRFYEFIVARYLRVDGNGGVPTLTEGTGAVDATGGGGRITHEQAVTIMDKLTRDPYQASKRTSQLLHQQEHAPGKVISSDGTETSTSRELTKRMFNVCIWANIIPFLAELTVQHGVLIYGYWKYYEAKKRREGQREKLEDEGKEDTCEDEESIDESAYALSLMFKSSRLTIARGMSWISASAGGALGSVVYPGWGTVFGIQIGDTIVGSLVD